MPGLGIFSGQGLAEGVTISNQSGVQLTGIAVTLIYTAIVTFVILNVVGGHYRFVREF